MEVSDSSGSGTTMDAVLLTWRSSQRSDLRILGLAMSQRLNNIPSVHLSSGLSVATPEQRSDKCTIDLLSLLYAGPLAGVFSVHVFPERSTIMRKDF